MKSYIVQSIPGMAAEMTQDPTSCASSFEQYESEVRAYGRKWFETDAAATVVIKRDPEVRSAVSRLQVLERTVGTEAIYQCDERWLPERLDVHRKLVADLIEGEENSSCGYVVDGSVIPQAVILLGMPGSGKSSLLRPVARELISRASSSAQLLVDADAVRAHLPEYKGGLGSEVVQPETSYITNYRLIEEAYRRRANLLLDTVGDPLRSLSEVRYMVRAGWSVWCICASVDVDVAVKRSQQRALQSGRYVPIAYLRSVGDRPVKAYRHLIDSQVPLAGGVLLDTNVPLGSRPLVLDTTQGEVFGAVGCEVALWPDSPSGREGSDGRPR